MSAALTRRKALAGSAWAALGLGAAAVPAAALEGKSPATAPSISAEARALQEEAGRLSREYRVACREADATLDGTADVEPPEALYERGGDARLFIGRVPAESWHDPGRRWWGEQHLIERLRGDTFRYLDTSPDRRAVARRDEVVGAWEAWHADMRAAEDASGHTAAQERFVATHEAYAAFRLHLIEMRTDDPGVMAAKALVFRDLCHGDDRLDRLLSSAIERDAGAYEAAFALSLTRDFLALMGADLRGQA